MQPWDSNALMHFPVLDALCPTVSQFGREIFTGGISPTDPVNEPAWPADPANLVNVPVEPT